MSQCHHPSDLRVLEPDVPKNDVQRWVCSKCLYVGTRVNREEVLPPNEFYYYLSRYFDKETINVKD